MKKRLIKLRSLVLLKATRMLKPTCRWLVQETHFHSQIHAPRPPAHQDNVTSTSARIHHHWQYQHNSTNLSVTTFPPLSSPHQFKDTMQSHPSGTHHLLSASDPSYGPWFRCSLCLLNMDIPRHEEGGEAFSDIIKFCCVLFAKTWMELKRLFSIDLGPADH